MGKWAITIGICCLLVSATSSMAAPTSVPDNTVTTGGLLVPPQPQTPKPPRTFPSKAILRGFGGFISFEDYPPAALRNKESGIVYFSMVVGPDGLPKSCSITKSSGSTTLDSETCRIAMRRVRFDPALDDKGTPIEGSYSSRVGWSVLE